MCEFSETVGMHEEATTTYEVCEFEGSWVDSKQCANCATKHASAAATPFACMQCISTKFVCLRLRQSMVSPSIRPIASISISSSGRPRALTSTRESAG